MANEIEILQLLKKEQDQDTFFRLDRALESYQKLEKAVLDDRIRLENEHRRANFFKKTNQKLSEAQKKRNVENQLKINGHWAVFGAITLEKARMALVFK